MWCKSVSEFQLKSDIKNWFFGLTTIEKFRAKQQSHLNLMAIKAAEASLRLFFMQINDRRRKIFIWQLEADGRSCTVILRKRNTCLTTLHSSSRLTLLRRLTAFDGIFLLEVQEWLGLAARWSVWVTTLLATASSSVFLNGAVLQNHTACLMKTQSGRHRQRARINVLLGC